MANEEKQWPDEAYRKAKAWADWLDSNSSKPFWSTERFLYDEVRAEERRREPKVCGAPYTVHLNCTKPAGHELPHEDEELCPPQCEADHLPTSDSRYVVISYSSGSIKLEETDYWPEAVDFCGMYFGVRSVVLDRDAPNGETSVYPEGMQCEKPHMTEAAQRVIQAAGRLQSAMHNRACGPTPEMNDSCRCGLTKLRETMSQFYREAQS